MLSNISMVQQLWWKNNNSIECVDEDIYAATLLLALTHWLHVVNSVLASATVELYTVYISAHLTYQKPPYRPPLQIDTLIFHHDCELKKGVVIESNQYS